jgi:hypothetical protein
MVIVRLWRLLLRDNPGGDVWMNSKHKTKKRSVPGTNIFPDVLNFSKQVAYEVHWAG